MQSSVKIIKMWHVIFSPMCAIHMKNMNKFWKTVKNHFKKITVKSLNNLFVYLILNQTLIDAS